MQNIAWSFEVLLLALLVLLLASPCASGLQNFTTHTPSTDCHNQPTGHFTFLAILVTCLRTSPQHPPLNMKPFQAYLKLNYLSKLIFKLWPFSFSHPFAHSLHKLHKTTVFGIMKLGRKKTPQFIHFQHRHRSQVFIFQVRPQST